MKMNYLLDKKTVFSSPPRARRQRRWPFFVVLIAVLVVGGPLLYQLLSSPAARVVGEGRASATATVFSLGHNIKFLAAKEKLLLENEKLRDQLKDSTRQMISLRLELEELRALAAAVGRPGDSRAPLLVAKVLAPLGFFNYDTLLIDGGTRTPSSGRNLAPGDLAVASADVLLGEVVQVGKLTSKIRLYSSAERTTAVLIGQANIVGLATGQGGGNYLVTLPAGSAVVHNDIVRATRGGREYVLGLVGAIEKNEETPFQKIYVKSPINIYELRFVEIYAR